MSVGLNEVTSEAKKETEKKLLGETSGERKISKEAAKFSIVQLDESTAMMEGDRQAMDSWLRTQEDDLIIYCRTKRVVDASGLVIRSKILLEQKDTQHAAITIYEILKELHIPFTPLPSASSRGKAPSIHQTLYPRKEILTQIVPAISKPSEHISEYKARMEFLNQYRKLFIKNVELLGKTYRILKLAGEGNYGIVFEAELIGKSVEDVPPSARKRALKLLKLAQDDEHLAFEKIQQSGMDCTNIVKSYGSQTTSFGFRWLILEWIDSPYNLYNLPKEKQNPAMLLQYRQQRKNAEDILEKLNICNYDQNETNVLIDREDRVKLIDFGSSIVRT